MFLKNFLIFLLIFYFNADLNIIKMLYLLFFFV